ncbi:hypothetical protein B0H16DRAFT_1495224 [Mycena metata]|uniref:Pentatricopeptide repeat-containing protein-mitochondrial domain-containing protein n=1 Tax=Mycena metata TaxID=1033252 RepID=A0AAD7P0T5_9AGAR|nr:hypothetical protein B0H16DRAFT_1495224 [Mycena metata]
MLLRRIVREKKGVLFCVRRHASADSGLRAQPWAFRENADTFYDDTAAFQKTKNRTTLLLCLAAEMKQKGIAPTLLTYNTLLRAFAPGGFAPASLAILEDMLSMDVPPDVKSFNYIIEAHRTEPISTLSFILARMEALGIAPNATTFTLLITRFVAEGNLEVSLQHLHAMKARNLLPEVAAAQAVIVLAANQGYPRLALDLVASFEKESVRKVENSVWLACLYSSAANLYAEGVSKSWYTLVADLAVSPDEGLCTLVLHTAARNGLPDLATDALRVLKVLDVPWMEYHLAPLFEAFCRAEQYQEAFSTLAIMRQNAIDPAQTTAFPIVQLVKKRPEMLDELWEVLNQMNKEGKQIDPSATCALLVASDATQPLSRTLADYNMLRSWGLGPSTETFNIFVDACIHAGNVDYGELAYKQLKEAGITPDHDAYARMITLHVNHEVYDDSFVYLEQMQEAGHLPGRHLYESLVLRCAAAGDDRYLLVLDEMKEVGHIPTPEFLLHCSELHARGRAAQQAALTRSRAEALKDSLGHPGMDGVAQKFIETGGLQIPDQK